MKYNPNFKYQNRQSTRAQRRKKEREEVNNRYYKFISILPDRSWWTSLTNPQKEKVYECYQFCKTEWKKKDQMFWYHPNELICPDRYADDPQPACFKDVENDFDSWIEMVMGRVGSKKKIRQVKLRELGIK